MGGVTVVSVLACTYTFVYLYNERKGATESAARERKQMVDKSERMRLVEVI